MKLKIFLMVGFLVGYGSIGSAMNNDQIQSYKQSIEKVEQGLVGPDVLDVEFGFQDDGRVKYGTALGLLVASPNTIAVAEHAVQVGANVNFSSSSSYVPLDHARHFRALKLLLEHGADIKKINRDTSILHAIFGYYEALYPGDMKKFFLLWDMKETMDRAIDYGADINKKYKDEGSIISRIASSRCISKDFKKELLERLIHQGASPKDIYSFVGEKQNVIKKIAPFIKNTYKAHVLSVFSQQVLQRCNERCAEQSGNCYIAKLPKELIQRIIGYLPHNKK